MNFSLMESFIQEELDKRELIRQPCRRLCYQQGRVKGSMSDFEAVKK